MKKILIFTLALTLAFSTYYAGENVYAKSSAIKVLKAKKSFKMTQGESKTFYVKTKKKYSKFTVKSSNKKVIKATKKGKTITLKALKKGKSKVTVKSKKNKKVKYVMNITVGKKTVITTPDKNTVDKNTVITTPDKNTVDKNNKLSVFNNNSNNSFVLNLKNNAEIKKEDLNVEAKANINDSYSEINSNYMLFKINDKKYSVLIDQETAHKNLYYRFSIKNTNDSVEAMASLADYDYSRYVLTALVKPNKSFHETLELNANIAHTLLLAENLPKGIEWRCCGNHFVISGETNAKPGVYKSILYTCDEDGMVYKFIIRHLVSSPDKITECHEDTVIYGYPNYNGKYEYAGFLDVKGYIGDKCLLTKLVLDPSTNPINVDEFYEPEEDVIGRYVINNNLLLFNRLHDIFFATDPSELLNGSYTKFDNATLKVKLEDEDNSDINTQVNVNLKFKEMSKISGYIKDKQGNPVKNAKIEVKPFDKYICDAQINSTAMYEPSDMYNSTPCYTDENGYYQVYVIPGNCKLDITREGSGDKTSISFNAYTDKTFDYTLD